MRTLAWTNAAIVFALGIAPVLACSSSSASTPPVTSRMTFARTDFFSAPFPSDDLLKSDGSVDVSLYPNPSQNIWLNEILSVVAKDARGFATTAGAFISFTDDLDPASLPDLGGTTKPGAAVAIVSVDDAAPDFGKKYPSWVTFQTDGGEYATQHLLSIVPLSGVPLRPKTTYAVIVTRDVHDVNGHALSPAPEMNALVNGQTPAGMPVAASATYVKAIAGLKKAGVDPTTLVAMGAFTTGDPTAQLAQATTYALSQPVPALTQPVTSADVFSGYCVYNTQLSMPDYQEGTPPYDTGGDWTFDANGNPIVQVSQPAGVVITVPRTPMPAAGYPIVLLERTGAGGNRPLVDRGVQGVTGGPPLTPGTGPAMEFAAVGYAGAQFDGPLGGLRNPTGDPGQEDFTIFNVSNGAALRDNIRESALETAVFEKVLEGITFDASACPGVGTTPVKFDVTHVSLMGHSMGATIAPLALAVQPKFQGAVLSGAGASWIENVLFKQQPLAVRPIIEALLGYASEHITLTRGDPTLTMLQWAVEPADPLVYTRSIIQEPPQGFTPRQILMEQGIVDHYIMPPIANATSLSLGLDIAGTELDTTSQELQANPLLTPLANVIQFSGRGAISFPVSANLSPSVTAIVVQHPADGIEDGHEVMFQTEPPKQEYRCFLQSLLQNGPAKVPDGNAGGSCP